MLFKRPPRIKQVEALAFLENKNAAALFMSMRTGKTKVIIDDWQRIGCDLLVIAPATVYKVWERALHDDALKMPRLLIWESGVTKALVVRAFEQHVGPRVLLVNIEALSTVETVRSLCVSFVKQRPTMVVIDESVVIKNHRAQRTKFINTQLAPFAAYRRILSGLPTPRSPLDIFSQFWFLNPGILKCRTYDQFLREYAHTKRMRAGGRSFNVVTGYKNIDQLYAKLAPHQIRVRLEDCTDLPKADYKILEVRLTKEQTRVYDEVRKYCTAQLANKKFITPGTVVTQLLRLQQVLLGRAVAEDDTVLTFPEYRIASLLEFLNSTDEKVVIFATEKLDIVKITNALQREFGIGSVANFTGDNRATREEEEQTFRNNIDCRFMVSTYSAGGMGRPWDVASIVVFYSPTQDYGLREQGEARPLAVGKTTPVLYVDMICPNTVETKWLKALRVKMNLAAQITGDAWREWVV